MVGNIATAAAASSLSGRGADAEPLSGAVDLVLFVPPVLLLGKGIPRLCIVWKVGKAAKAGADVPIIADGGVRYTGDISQATSCRS